MSNDETIALENDDPILPESAEINESTVLLLRLIRLIGRITRRKDQLVSQPFEAVSGLNIKVFHTLYLIAQGSRLPGELVRELGIPNSTTTRILDTLVAEGLIERRAVPSDRRLHELVLTESGKQRYDTAWAQYLTCLLEGFGELPASDLQPAVAALSRLELTLKEQDKGDESGAPSHD
jgi:DNA-binding MarR family transcriptional regulator